MGQFDYPPPWLITEFVLHLAGLFASFFDMRHVAVGQDDQLCWPSCVAIVCAEVLHCLLRWKTDTVLEDGIELGDVMPIGSGYD